MTLEERFAAFEAKLEAAAGHLVTEFRDLFGAVKEQAVSDGEKLAAQAETAAAPVVAAAEQDAGQLAATVAADVEHAASAPAAPAAEAPKTEGGA